MEKEVDISVIKATQSSLGKYVKRPPLTEKLLKKPPFRFIHDIVTTVLKTTGFFEGLFDENELVSDNVKDRDAKLLFLNKVITVLNHTTEKTINVKATKIVAGQEPERTNELLQSLALALDKNLSSSEAVKIYKEKDKNKRKPEKDNKISDNPKQNKNEKKLTSRSNEKLITQKKDSKEHISIKTDKNKNNDNKAKEEKVNQNNVSKKQSLKKIQANSKNVTNKSKTTELENIKSEESKGTEVINNETIIQNENVKNNEFETDIIKPKNDIIEDDITSQNEVDQLQNEHIEANTDNLDSLSDLSVTKVTKQNEKEEANDNDMPTDNIIRSTPTNDNNIKDTTHTTSINQEQIIKNIAKEDDIVKDSKLDQVNIPKSAIVSQNTDKDKNENVTASAVRPASVRPPSSRPGAPRLRERHDDALVVGDNLLVGKVNIIVENVNNDEEEDTSLVIEPQISTQPSENENTNYQQSSNQHGHLVQQILESQKELSQNSTGRTEIEWAIDAQKAKDASNQEVEQIRFNVQALSRLTNPLGKLLDHIQEDVEVMRQELEQWTETYEKAAKELTKQKLVNEESLLPLHTKIKQLDMDIEDKRDKINDLKIIIYRNNSRINNLLESGNIQ